ncbi:MAG: class I SAM-dependent methyltransferase [Candidatus Kapaibacterium sp.]
MIKENMQHYAFHENVWGYKKRIDTMLTEIKQRSAPKESFTILDVGCGNGALVTLPIAEAGYKILGIDLDPDSIDIANQLNSSPNAEFRVCTLEALPANSFDFVICSEVLEHITEYNEFISELHRVAKKGATIFITVPNGWGPFEIERFVFERSGLLTIPRLLRNKLQKRPANEYANSTENMDCGHVNFFRYNRIKKAIENRFAVEKSYHSTFLSGPVTNILFKNSSSFLHWNATFSNKLPHFLSSGWYFVCKKT